MTIPNYTPTERRRAMVIWCAKYSDLPASEAEKIFNEASSSTQEKYLRIARRIGESDADGGLVLVPKVPTLQMLLAGMQAALDYYGLFGLKRLWPWSRGKHPSRCLAACYQAMVTAETTTRKD